MPGKYRRVSRTKSDYSVFVGCAPGNFHSERTDRHTRNRQACYACRPLGEYALHISDRHVTFEGNAVDEGGVARRQRRLHPEALVKAGSVCIVDDLDGLTKCLGDLCCPGFAAATAGIAVHDDIACRQCGRGHKGKGQCQQIFTNEQ